MSDILEKKAVAKEAKVKSSTIQQPIQTGNQQQQPDTATFTKQTLADLPQNMPAAKLQVRNLDFYYGDFRALKEINIDIPEKNVTAFIGPSAAVNQRYCALLTACTICTLACAQKAN